MEKYEGWYDWATMVAFQQGMGRVIRSKDDWAKSYILDGSFGWFFQNNSLPSYINSRKEMRNINSIDKSMKDIFNQI